MATPLKKWFVVADSMLREDLTQRGRSTFLGLLAWFNQRRSRDGVRGRRACEASIPPGDMLTITLEETLERAREALSEIAPRFELKIEPRNAFTFVYWPNVSKWLDFRTPKSGKKSGGSREDLTRDPPLPIRSDPTRHKTLFELESDAPKKAPDKRANGAVVLERMRHQASVVSDLLLLPALDCRWTKPRQKLISMAHRDYPEHGAELGVAVLEGWRRRSESWSAEVRLAGWSVEALFAPANVGRNLQATVVRAAGAAPEPGAQMPVEPYALGRMGVRD